MDKRLLLGRSRRRQWPRKNPSFVKIAAVSEGSLKFDQNVICHSTKTRSVTQGVVSCVNECFQTHFASYSAYEILGHWTVALLQTPLDAFPDATSANHEANTRLSSLLTMFVAPIVVCYLFHSAAQYFKEEYRIFLALGQGGTPCTPMGMIKVTIMGFFANVDVFDPPYVDPSLKPAGGQLSNLPQRPGPRPTVKGVAPQRQFDQEPAGATFDKLSQVLKSAAAKDENLKIATSYLEGHTDALKGVFADRPRKTLDTDGEWDYEIAHPHRKDSSMHLVCHPEDCKKIIEAGWGQKHPLSTDAKWWKYLHHSVLGKRLPVPPNLVLVYGPRNPTEFQLVEKLIDAAIWYHKEKDMYDRINGGLLKQTFCGIATTQHETLGGSMLWAGLNERSICSEGILDDRIGKAIACDTIIPQGCTLAASNPLSVIPVTKSCA